MKYLWDTNTVIYYLQRQFPESSEKFIDETLKESMPSFSVITEIELLCWKTAKKKDIKVLQEFISKSHVFGLEKDVKLKTVEIRKKHKIKLPDAIIAATAIVQESVFLTRNVKDFKGIEELRLLNPHEK